MASGFLSIIQNCLRLYPESKSQFREHKGIQIIKSFTTCEFVNLKTKSVIIMAFSIREDEMHLLETTEGHIQYILSLLKKAVSAPDYRFQTFSVEELLGALNKIAESDSNKLEMVQKGALPLYVRLIREENTDKVVCQATRGLWTLAFPEENKEKLMTEPECIANLEKLKFHANRQISQAAEGALWLISLALAKFRRRKSHLGTPKVFPSLPIPTSTAKINQGSEISRKSSNSTDSGSLGHIMLSYSWNYKPVVHQFKAGLQKAGYKIWIDDDEMSGSLLEGMATAIENASLVVIFVSESYKESPSCRTEAEYIFRLKKPILPIMNQPDYTPDGWLGALVGSQLHFICPKPEEVDELLPKVVKEIEHKLCPPMSKLSISGGSPTDLMITERKVSIPQTAQPRQPRFTEWTIEKVSQWLTRTVALPPEVAKKFQGFDGPKLGALYRMYKKAPASFYNTLTQQFEMSLIDLLSLSDGLEKLTAK